MAVRQPISICSADAEAFLLSDDSPFLFLHGDAGEVLRELPEHVADCCLTSPPYWSQRKYDSDSGLGAESLPTRYVDRLVGIFRELKRVLRPEGSLWLNLGDTYIRKNLCGIPWRVALALQADGWILRNAIVWDKMKGNPCNAKDKLRNVYEYVFHFVQQSDCFYDMDSVRNQPQKPSYRNGRVVTPTGVSGAKYERQIQTSAELSPEEKEAALLALEEALEKVRRGEMPDFRMVIRGCQRATHSDSLEFSGRANELLSRGFCILPYHRNGTKPGDVWRIIPEDEWRKDDHYAVFPIELCELPIKATCPTRGIVLDPFVGTGSSVVAAILLGRRGIGIDTSQVYLCEAESRALRAIAQRRQTASQQHLF